MAFTTTAVIMARGLGSRMRKASASNLTKGQERAASEGAKGMMPFARPFLDYVLSALADAGITEVVLVVAPGENSIRRYYAGDGAPQRTIVKFAEQPEPRGTADAVLAARREVNDAPFLVLNSDNYYPVDAYRELARLAGSGLVGFEQDALVRESGIEPERVLRYALIDADAGGFLREIREKPRADDPLTQRAERFVSMNLWSFTPSIFDACERVTPSARGELELVDAVTIAMRERGEQFRVLTMSAGVLDLSSRADVAFVASKLAETSPRP